MVNLTILENNTLRVSWDNEQYGSDENKSYMRNFNNENPTMWSLHEILDDCLGNGWSLFDAVQLGHMSSAPVICEAAVPEGDGTITVHGRQWYFANYMIENPVTTLLDNGFVNFQAVE